jgi:hypothetical protein
MTRTFIKGFLLVFMMFLLTLITTNVWAEDPWETSFVPYTDQELDDLLAPIALYPDPLLAELLPASTYPEEVGDAEAWLAMGGEESRIDEQDWAESVRAIAHYPDILQWMSENMDWTANLGDAFLNQPEDVTNSIQRLRWQARAVGNLVTNDEQIVIIDGDYIQIVPAQPQYVYLPQYDTSVVYIQAPRYSPFVTFGIGLAIGGWLTMDFDWYHHHVIYHGWDRPGWVDHARPYVHVRDVYVNRSRSSMGQTWKHDRAHGDPARYLASRPSGPNADRYARMGEARGGTVVQGRPPAGKSYNRGEDARAYSERGRESRGIVAQQAIPVTPRSNRKPAVPIPNIGQRPTMPSMPSPGIRERPTVPAPNAGQRPAIEAPRRSQPPTVAPRRDGFSSAQPGPARAIQQPQPARTPSGAFGGYRGTGEARTESLRGQASRQSIERAQPSAPAGRRGSGPAGKDASGDRKGR